MIRQFLHFVVIEENNVISWVSSVTCAVKKLYQRVGIKDLDLSGWILAQTKEKILSS